MAMPLDSYEFPRRGKYPWEFWLNGQAWKITQKDIGDASMHSFIVAAAVAAHRRGLRLKTHKVSQSTVIVQAIAPEV